MFIAEQQLVAAAVGLAVRGYIPFAATFAAFLSRAYDFIRMSAISQANIRLCGSHAGVEIGADGPSQMALEDLAMMRAVHGSTVLYPATRRARPTWSTQMAERAGIVYMRTTRGAYPVLYGPDEAFPIGGAKVVRSSPEDQVALIGAGVTLHNCLAAADQLAAGRHPRPRRGPVLGQADRRPDAARGRRRDRRPGGGRRGPLPRGRHRRRGAGRVQRRGPPGPGQPPGRPGPARLRDARRAHGRRPGSPPTRSPRPPATCSAADAVETPARGARPPSPGMRRCQYAHLALCRRQRCGV